MDQREVDIVRIRVLASCLATAVMNGEKKVPVRHLWFPEERVTYYRLRDGNPPADVDRPKHLRGLRLEIDIGEIPEAVADAVKARLAKAIADRNEPTSIIKLVKDPDVIDAVSREARKGTLFH